MMSLNPKTRRTLEDLIEKSDQLSKYGFTEHAVREGRGFGASRNPDDTWDIRFALPAQEKRDATLLTLRLFIHQREDYSFHRLDKLADDRQLSDNFSSKIHNIRKSYFTFLNGHPAGVEAGFFEKDKHPTRGEILDVVLNGSLSHTRDYYKRQQFKLWSGNGVRHSILLQEFTQIMIVLLTTIKNMSELAQIELAAHQEDKTAG